MKTKKNSFMTAFQIYLPEDLGIIDNVLAHVQIGNETIDVTTIWHEGRYLSMTGIEWSRVFRDDNNFEITKYQTLKTCSIAFPIEIWDLVEGFFYLTFTGWKNENLTFYHTEKHFFKKSDKLIVYRQ